MPADAQDTHIMKAHLRKHEVFHNIASALENAVFNNSLGNRNHRSQHLVGTSFRRFEHTDMQKIKRGKSPVLVGWLVGWLGTPNPLRLAEVLSATRGDRVRNTFHHPRQHLPSTRRGSSGKPIWTMKRRSTKTDPAADRCPRKEGNAPRDPQRTARKTHFSSSSDSGNCGKR